MADLTKAFYAEYGISLEDTVNFANNKKRMNELLGKC